LDLKTPRVAVLGTDCCIGKRTTASLLTEHLRAEGVKAEMISTGQTGYLQGTPHGFFFDATPNDFVSGELERVTLECVRASTPELIIFEGQSSFFNPSGPCGAEFILSGGARHVILQHAPKREFHDDLEHLRARIPPPEKHIAMAELLGATVLAVSINEEGMTRDEAVAERDRLQDTLKLPVVLPLQDGVGELAQLVKQQVLVG
ncbi:MAG: NAD-dependent epimerase/dehydratase family protein, partial [Myxococcota bacterium]